MTAHFASRTDPTSPDVCSPDTVGDDYRRHSVAGRVVTTQTDRTETSRADGDAASRSARRQEVIDAAAGVFARHGFHGIGTRALADELGIKAASLYFHVKSKDHVLEEICNRGIDPPIRFVETTLSMPQGVAERLRCYFSLMRTQLHEEADYISVFVQERRHLKKPASTKLERKLRVFRKGLQRIFEEAHEHGDLHPDLSPRSATLIMIGTIRNLTQHYVEGPISNFDGFMDDSVEALIRGIRGSK